MPVLSFKPLYKSAFLYAFGTTKPLKLKNGTPVYYSYSPLPIKHDLLFVFPPDCLKSASS